MYYFYRKSDRGHGICPLYRGCPPFGESIIRGTPYIKLWVSYRICHFWGGGSMSQSYNKTPPSLGGSGGMPPPLKIFKIIKI